MPTYPCPDCGNPLSPDALVCPKCGSRKTTARRDAHGQFWIAVLVGVGLVLLYLMLAAGGD